MRTSPKERAVKKIKAVILALALTAFVAGSLWAADLQPQAKCPVLGGNVNKQVYADYKDKRIYFCCAGCDKEFKKDPGTHPGRGAKKVKPPWINNLPSGPCSSFFPLPPSLLRGEGWGEGEVICCCSQYPRPGSGRPTRPPFGAPFLTALPCPPCP